MAFRFRKSDRSVERAVRRIAGAQIDKAIAAIDGDLDASLVVHDVRRRCKALRGLVRLIGPTFEAYADENADFRDIGRLLQGLRDARVLQDTFDGLAEASELIDEKSRRACRAALQGRHSGDGAERLKQARERLVLARARVRGWTLAADEWAAIGPGLMRTAIRGRDALDWIGSSHAADPHHELRKHVKYHWQHMRLLRPLAKRQIKARARLAAELGDCLGEHHDLAVLDAALASDASGRGADEQLQAFRLAGRRRRMLLGERGVRMARQLLGETAASLTERFGEDWSAWRS
jgi:hypothetical protein